ncbi:MAG TPA: hypothetical protein VMZ29_04695 [Candidatus Bathyarchaeia archaeon]|nr:hypothetical protein [Candidatus Bathyarchaeia archaeon]
MNQISEEKKREVYELVEKQKKAKISWVAIITQLPEEDIITIGWDFGLVIEKDQIMLPTETEEGKIEAKIQNERKRKILQKALSERIFRYRIGETKGANWNKIDDIMDVLAFFDADLISTGIEFDGYITEIGKAIKRNIDVSAETYVCKLDGQINYFMIKSNQISLLGNILIKEIKEKYGENLHYLISLKYYYETFSEPQGGDLLKEVEHKKRIIALCKFIDNKINTLCNELANQSVMATVENRNNYKILLTTGKRIESTKKFFQFYKYSIYLSYRTSINQLYYEFVGLGKIQGINEFTINHSFDQINLYQKYLQIIFEELIYKFDMQQQFENMKKIRLAIQTL